MPKYSNCAFLHFGFPTGQPFVNGTTVSQIISEISILVPSFQHGVVLFVVLAWFFLFGWFVVFFFQFLQTYEVSLHTPSTTPPQDMVKVSKELPVSYDYHTLRTNPKKAPIYEITQGCLPRATNRFGF